MVTAGGCRIGGHPPVHQHAVAQREPVVGVGSAIVTSMAMSKSHAGGPFTLIARPSKICSGVSCDNSDGEDACVAVPKLPSRSSVAPDRKKLRHVAFSAP